MAGFFVLADRKGGQAPRVCVRAVGWLAHIVSILLALNDSGTYASVKAWSSAGAGMGVNTDARVHDGPRTTCPCTGERRLFVEDVSVSGKY